MVRVRRLLVVMVSVGSLVLPEMTVSVRQEKAVKMNHSRLAVLQPFSA